MNKSELISAISRKTGFRKADIQTILDAYVDIVSDELADEREVQLVGFGKFRVSEVKEHLGRSLIDTTEVIKVPASKRVYFSAGSRLKEKINKK